MSVKITLPVLSLINPSSFKRGLSEIDRYPAFVNLSNAILELVAAEDSPLKDLLRGPDDTHILFYINHPELFALRFGESNIDHSPDIVIVGEESVRNAVNNSEMTRPQLLKLAAISTISKYDANLTSRFSVAALLACVDIKKKTDMAEPPNTWPREQQSRFVDPRNIDDSVQGRAENDSRNSHGESYNSGGHMVHTSYIARFARTVTSATPVAAPSSTSPNVSCVYEKSRHISYY